MRKIFYLIGISALFLISSCNNDDIPQSVAEVKKYAPVVQGTFGQLTEVNPETGTRAGVVEENDDYASGEQFYWHDGDQIKLLFFEDGDTGSDPTELIYTAVVESGQPNTAQFFTTDLIEPGTYTVYGLYPADGWDEDYNVFILDAPGQEFIPVTDNTSKHLGRYMYMKADVGEVTIGEEVSDPISLDFEHLTSVIRVRIRNNNPDPHPEFTILHRLSMGVNEFDKNFYPLEAQLEGGITDDFLTVDNLEVVTRVRLTDEALNGFELDFFIPILPTGPFDTGDNLTFQAFFYSAADVERENELSSPPLNFPMEFIGAGGTSLLTHGFEAGKSYYFNISIIDPLVDPN